MFRIRIKGSSGSGSSAILHLSQEMLNEDSKDSDMEYHSMYLQNIVITSYACFTFIPTYITRGMFQRRSMAVR